MAFDSRLLTGIGVLVAVVEKNHHIVYDSNCFAFFLSSFHKSPCVMGLHFFSRFNQRLVKLKG